MLNKTNFLKNKKGMATLIIVTIFCALLMIMGLSAYNYNKTMRAQTIFNTAIIRTNFIAKAGIQHALLKFKLLPTEAYDAVCFTLGRNPYYDFAYGGGDDPDPDLCPGPPYLGTCVASTPTNFIAAPPVPFSQTEITSYGAIDNWLKWYMADLRSKESNGVSASAATVFGLVDMTTVDNTTWPVAPAIKVDWADGNYAAVYQVVQFNILGSEADRQYKNDSVKIIVKAAVAQQAPSSAQAETTINGVACKLTVDQVTQVVKVERN